MLLPQDFFYFASKLLTTAHSLRRVSQKAFNTEHNGQPDISVFYCYYLHMVDKESRTPSFSEAMNAMTIGAQHIEH